MEGLMYSAQMTRPVCHVASSALLSGAMAKATTVHTMVFKPAVWIIGIRAVTIITQAIAMSAMWMLECLNMGPNRPRPLGRQVKIV